MNWGRRIPDEYGINTLFFFAPAICRIKLTRERQFFHFLFADYFFCSLFENFFFLNLLRERKKVLVCNTVIMIQREKYTLTTCRDKKFLFCLFAILLTFQFICVHAYTFLLLESLKNFSFLSWIFFQAHFIPSLSLSLSHCVIVSLSLSLSLSHLPV